MLPFDGRFALCRHTPQFPLFLQLVAVTRMRQWTAVRSFAGK